MNPWGTLPGLLVQPREPGPGVSIAAPSSGAGDPRGGSGAGSTWPEHVASLQESAPEAASPLCRPHLLPAGRTPGSPPHHCHDPHTGRPGPEG